MPRPPNSKTAARAASRNAAPGTVTMTDVARALGLSASTVSLALSGRRALPEATRRRVLEKAEELGYRKNLLVAALMETRRRGRPVAGGTVIAFLDFHADAAELKRATQPDYFAGCAAEAERMSLRLERYFVRDPAMPARRLCSILHARGIRGAILGACAIPGYAPDFEWDKLCWTSMTVSIDAPPLDLVNADHFGDLHSALLQARRLGYRRVALAMRQVADDRLRRAWLGAYLAHVGSVNPDGPLEPYCENDWKPATMRRWLRRVKPDLLIGPIAEKKMLVIEEAAASPLKRPDVISVSVPQGDDRITGYRENWPVMEIEAVRHLAGQLMRNETGLPRVPRLLRIPGTWNPGRTARSPL